MAKDNKEIRITVRLSSDQAKKLDRLCAGKRITTSEFIRSLVDKAK